MTEPKVRPIVPGQVVPILNSPLDVPTFYVDMIANMALDDTVAKLSFVESLATSDGLRGRHVVNIAFNRENISVLIHNLSSVLEKTDGAKANESDK